MGGGALQHGCRFMSWRHLFLARDAAAPKPTTMAPDPKFAMKPEQSKGGVCERGGRGVKDCGRGNRRLRTST